MLIGTRVSLGGSDFLVVSLCYCILLFVSFRIVLMRHGVFQASGSCSFLEERFKLGYKLSVVGCRRSSCVEERYQTMFDHFSDKIRLVRKIGAAGCIFQVPTQEEDCLPYVLRFLESEKKRGNIETFGIESFSLMEVFHSLAEDSDEFSACSAVDSGLFRTLPPGQSVDLPDVGTGRRNKSLPWILRISLFLWKRWIVQKRDLRSLALSSLFILLLVALALTILTVRHFHGSPPIGLNLRDLKTLAEPVVDVAGGAAFLNRYTIRRDWEELIDTLTGSINTIDSDITLWHHENITNSNQLFAVLEDSFDGPSLEGMLVFQDVIKLNWKLDREFAQWLTNEVTNKLATETTDIPLLSVDENGLSANLLSLPEILLSTVREAIDSPLSLTYLSLTHYSLAFYLKASR